jgi:hypothetical protein
MVTNSFHPYASFGSIFNIEPYYFSNLTPPVWTKKESCGGCGEPCTKITDLYGNETQPIFVGASPS